MRILAILLLAACPLAFSAPGDLELSPSATVHEVIPAPDAGGPRVLAVVAHPDDEIAFAATLYKTATLLRGVADLVVITNGEAGFKYSTLAEPIYGLKLTDEAVGRKHLPAIRRNELIDGCRILRVRRIYALNQRDHRYTLDPNEVLAAEAHVWDLAVVRRDLRAILDHGKYDFVLTHLPVPSTHGHHKAATILALETVRAMPVESRPVVLGAARPEAGREFTVLEGFPVTRLRPETPPFVFDRTQPFGFDNRLNYQILVNWAIAEHKSQGTMQLFMNHSDTETYRLYALDPDTAVERTRSWFESLARPQFPSTGVSEPAGQKK
jgi:LmbE family N-acetylglucosaminyl deacetylase